MSEHEFETYLKLLASLLRLSDAQRDLIADELRDHLEQRLDAMTAEGVDRQRAIQIALEEFGDAAGLADQFTRITRQQRRRRIMRTTLGTVVAAAAVVLVVSYLMPVDRAGVPGTPSATAEDAAQGFEAETVEHAPWRDHATPMLGKRIDIAFEDTPLGNALDYLREVSEANFFVNWRQLAAVGVDNDLPVTMQLEDVTCEAALRLVLESVAGELDYHLKDNVVVVSTVSDFEDRPITRIYDCGDLILGDVRRVPLRDQAASAEADDGSSPDAGDEWTFYTPYHGQQTGTTGYGGGYGEYGGGYGMGEGRTRGGRVATHRPNLDRQAMLLNVVHPLQSDLGTISMFEGLLIVRDTPAAQQRVEQVLDMLRVALEVREAEAAGGRK